MTINMKAPDQPAELERESLSKILKSKPQAAIIFCQELPRKFEEVVPDGYDYVKAPNEAAVMWDTSKFKTLNEVSEKEQGDERYEIKAIKTAKDHPPNIVTVKLTMKNPTKNSTLVVLYNAGQYSRLNEKEKRDIFLILVNSLNKVIESNNIGSYIICGDFNFDTSTLKLPTDVKVLSYDSGKGSCKPSMHMDYYVCYSREIKYKQLIHKNCSDKHRPRIVESSIISDGVNENVLSFCQSTNRESSNACTIIAVLAAIDFLSGTEWFSLTYVLGLSDYCYKLFNKGNQMYDSLDVGQTNYSAPDILEHENFVLKNIAERGDEYQFNTLDALLPKLSPTGHKLAFVLIFHPDKSMVLLINERGESILIDSHLHLDIGAIVATASHNKLKDMIKYIENMINREWGLKISEKTPFDVTTVKLK